MLRPRRDGAEVLKLHEHVGVDRLLHFIRAAEAAGVREDFEHRFGVVIQPIGHVGHVLQRVGVQQAVDGAAFGVAADDDVRHAQADNGELDRGRHAADQAIVLRHKVAGVAEDKQLAGLGVREQKRVHARVAARDNERLGRLAGRELLEQFSIVRKNLALKRAYAGNDVLHGSCAQRV